MEVDRFEGCIFGAAFASGERLVVGRWVRSPLGSFADLMWARPDGTRLLITPRQEVAELIDRHYTFDVLERADVQVRIDGAHARADVPAFGIALELTLAPPGPVGWLLALRPRRLRTAPPWIAVEDRALRPLVGPLLGGAAGIRSRGRTRAGVREWYAVHEYRPAAIARATIEGTAAGPVARHPRPARFGFSEFAPRPSLVRVTSLIER